MTGGDYEERERKGKKSLPVKGLCGNYEDMSSVHNRGTEAKNVCSVPHLPSHSLSFKNCIMGSLGKAWNVFVGKKVPER
eukprot:scaffold93133_cov22-Tisochrysis_lutea.AAC.1